jgi:RHS repeat-associated protein
VSPDAYSFTGRELDASGLNYHRLRYYHPGYGRFTSRDPIGLAGGINPYAYAGNDPVSFADPSGLLAAQVGNAVSDYAGRAQDYLRNSPAANFLGGVATGGAVGAGVGYGLAAASAACLPCGIALGAGLLGYSGYELLRDDFAGARSLGNSFAAAANGTANPDQAFAVGGTIGGLLGGGVGGRLAGGTGSSASGAGDLTRVGRWMSETEFNQMSATGRVVEGAGGRTSVTRPPDPLSFRPPPSSTIFAEFNVPSGILRQGGRPEWAIIPGPNIQTRIFGPAPANMPAATCIACVVKK